MRKARVSASVELRVVGALALAAFAGLAAGCQTPVSAKAVGFSAAFAQVESSGLAQPHAGLGATSILRRFGLEEVWRQDRPAALAELQRVALEGGRPEVVFALAQLSFAWGEDLRAMEGRWADAQEQYLRSAVYAWLFLFPESDALPSPYDVRFRDALGLYSRALVLAFAQSPAEGAPVDLADRVSARLFGTAREILVSTEYFSLPRDEVAAFFPSQAFVIEGMAVRNQIPGLGAPLIGRLRQEPGGLVRAVGASLVLRVEGGLADFAGGGGRLALELRSPTLGPEIEVGTRRVPVAHDLSAPMAYALSDEKVWDLAFRQFFRERADIPTGIYPEAPHRPGRIPVVLIHGTVSSPVVWAAAMNTLRADPLIRENFEFWLFIYRSGYPINYSAVALRTMLAQKLADLRAQGGGDELNQLVVVGHSQGGLLAKLTAVDPGRALWDAIFNGDYDPAAYEPEMRVRLEKGFFFKPLPEVKRVVFLATPHRGSNLTDVWLVGLVRRALKSPQEVLRATATVMNSDRFDRSVLRSSNKGLPTSVEDMSPQNPWLRALAELPLAPGVRSHSIVAVKDPTKVPDGTDGVVPYRSAHVDFADSEKIVRSNHSVQKNLVAIEELRRLLRLHLEEVRRQRAVPASPAS